MKVVIADDHPLSRAGMRHTLGQNPSISVVAEAETSEETQRMVEQWCPDVLLLDVQMPGGPCADVVRAAQTSCPEIKVLIVSAGLDRYVLTTLRAANIRGYLLKDDAPQWLLAAVQAVGSGGTWFSDAVAAELASIDEQSAFLGI